MLLKHLQQHDKISPPKFLAENTLYLSQMGSVAYGVSGETSDIDVYGFCIPPKDLLFTHLRGEVPGFGTQTQRFECWQEHHVKDPNGQKEYDFAVYSIVRYFHLCMENNPNMIDSLFTPRRCVLHTTRLGELVRENRRTFLHKGSYYKFKGYAYQQLKKIKAREQSANPKRQANIDEFGYDLKAAYHVVRLALEAEQILVEHDLDLERNREQLKAIRRGEWSFERLESFFEEKEASLESLYASSTLQAKPDERKIKSLLMDCLEDHYGSLNAIIPRDVEIDAVLREMQAVIDRYAAKPTP